MDGSSGSAAARRCHGWSSRPWPSRCCPWFSFWCLAGDFATGFAPAALTYAFWEPAVAMGMIAGSLWLVRVHGNAVRPVWAQAAALSYGAFVLHAPIIVTLAILIEPVPAAPILVLVLVGGLGSALSFAASALLRHQPFMRRII